ncbi:MAG: cation diffusion facilitator family transporter [Candidatus Odinarchaeia archaeon]
MGNRYTQIKKVLWIILFINIAVVIAKFSVGLLSNVLSMIADSFHSMLDASGNIIGLIGVKFAEKEPDKEHPYGHSKYENLAAIFIILLIILTSIEILQSAIGRLFTPVLPVIGVLNWLVMLSTILVNICITVYERKKGKEYNSDILLADATHTFSDIFVSLSVIVSFILISAGYPIFDVIISIGIAVFLFIVGFKMVKNISRILIDTSVVEPDLISEVVYSVKGVKNVHNIRSRGSENSFFIDLHFTVDPEISIKDAHEVANKVEKKLKEAFPNVEEVITHVEPE